MIISKPALPCTPGRAALGEVKGPHAEREAGIRIAWAREECRWAMVEEGPLLAAWPPLETWTITELYKKNVCSISAHSPS